MVFKCVEDILRVDPRFVGLVTVQDGEVRQINLADHHAAIKGIQLNDSVPEIVSTVFDRARSTLLYAYFDYDLLVVGEVQAFGAVEMALKYRLDGRGDAARGTLRNLVDRARKEGILPPLATNAVIWMDPMDSMIRLRNGLSHGTADVHSPDMALGVVETCARLIDQIFPA